MAETDQDHGYATVGERLRQAREARGLTLDDVAAQTRIPIRHLRNIEDSNWEDLPASTYTVGFARSYANSVGLDGAEIGRELREQLGGGIRTQQVSPEIYAPPDPSRVPSRRLAWMAGILLVVLVAAWLLVIRPWLTGDEEEAPPAVAEQPAPQPAAPPQPAVPQNLAGQPVTLVATDEVWFRVSDGGRRVEDRTLQAQGQYQVPSNLSRPTISTGRPQVLRVVVGGRDLGALASEERTMSGVSLLPNDLGATLGQPPQGAAPAQGAPAAQGGNGFRPML